MAKAIESSAAAARPQTMRELGMAVDGIRVQLVHRDELDSERRKLDDERSAADRKQRDELLTKTEANGNRVSALETKWEGFFGEQGAWPLIVAKLDDHGGKMDGICMKLEQIARRVWIGVGIVLTLSVAAAGIADMLSHSGH